MPSSLYVCLQDDDKIAAFAIDTDTGRLTRQTDLPVAGGPSVLALSPVRQVLYVGHRTRPSISSFRIDQATGGLMFQSSVSLEHAPTFLATDRTGKYLLCAYYQGGYAMRQCILSERKAGWAPRRSSGRRRLPARTPSRPIPPTGSLLCRTSPA